MPFNKYYTNLPPYPANNYYGNTLHKPRIKRTYGWDCPFQDYGSNKHYNTQRHINLIHGYGEPIDHLTGETRQQKRSAAVQTFNQPLNISMYPKTTNAQPWTYPEPRYTPMGHNPNAIRLPFLEAVERSLVLLGQGAWFYYSSRNSLS